MAESSPQSSPHQQPDPPNELKDSDPQNPYPNPNPNPTSESEGPSQDPQPQTRETQNPPDDPQNPPNPDIDHHEQPQIVVENQEQDDQEPEHGHGSDGMSLTLSPLPHPSISDTTIESKGNNPPLSSSRRPPKRKKGKKSQFALEKKLQTLNQNFNPIQFVPEKNLDFSRFEELLKRLGLWDFTHVEFDRSLRIDLITQLIVNYAPKVRGSYVNDCKIGVNRADLGRALKLPVKKPPGDCVAEEFPVEFLSFLDEFVSNWILLHEDLWLTPSEVLNWTNLIKTGYPQKVDWAGLVWFMVEKELAQGTSLKDCYYASHLQLLIKTQKEDLLKENSIVEVMAEEDHDGGDVKMLDLEEISSGVLRSDDQSSVSTPMKIVSDADKVEIVDVIEKKEEIACSDKAEKTEDVDKVKNVVDAIIVGSGNDEVQNTGSADEVVKVENEIAECIENIDKVHEYVENVGSPDDGEENVANVDEHVEVFDNTENAEEEGKDEEMMDFSYCKEDEQGSWLLDGKNDGVQQFLQRCSASDTKLLMEDGRQVGDDEGIKHEDVEEDGHVEGFRIMQKGPLDGISQANLMQSFEAEQLHYSSADLGGQSSLQLMSPRAENNMMLGGPSMFNQAGKREMEHEHDIADHDLNDNHKKMRIDGSWEHKSSEFHMLIDQIVHLAGRAKMAHEVEKEEAYEQGNVNQQLIDHEVAKKDNEILMLRLKVDEIERRRQAEVHRLDRELYLMNSVIGGYRKALKESQKAFAEYRKRCAIPDEPIYKDAGSGGVVKSVMELEKERIKQEEERKMICYILEDTYAKHMKDYELKWDELLTKVQSLDARLLMVAGEVELLKEHPVKSKTSESAPIESEDTPLEGTLEDVQAVVGDII